MMITRKKTNPFGAKQTMAAIDHAQKLVHDYRDIEGRLETAMFGGLIDKIELEKVNTRLAEIKSDIISIMGLKWFEDALY